MNISVSSKTMLFTNYTRTKALIRCDLIKDTQCSGGAYLFVLLVTTLNNSSSYFLLLSERPPLLESRVG